MVDETYCSSCDHNTVVMFCQQGRNENKKHVVDGKQDQHQGDDLVHNSCFQHTPTGVSALRLSAERREERSPSG